MATEKNIKLTNIVETLNHFGRTEKCEMHAFVAVSFLLVSIVFAATEPLNVKTGLWPSD